MLGGRGLENAVAADSSICYIDGERGILAYRGIGIHELAEKSSFEEVCHLLWAGRLPRREELDVTRSAIGCERAIPRELLNLLTTLSRTSAPMDALRTAVSALADSDADARDMSEEANRRKAVRLTAQLATVVAAFARLRQDKAVVPPDPGRSHADDFLRMVHGETARSSAIRALDTALVLHADHGLNAPSLAARVAASALSDMHSAITSAIGALKGPLHGEGSQAVLRMLEEIGSIERVDGEIRSRLARKEEIPGFGHPVYSAEDPRTAHLRVLSGTLSESTGETRLYDMSRRIEKIMSEERKLYASADFYSASLYSMLGLPPDLFTPVFAVSRICGWTARVLEQYSDNRPIRPL